MKVALVLWKKKQGISKNRVESRERKGEKD